MDQLCHSDHVLLFPFPAKGHMKPFFYLAQLLCNAGLKVTLLNTDHNHSGIDNDNLDRLSDQLPLLRFESIPDGLPPDQPRNVLDLRFHASMNNVMPSLFKELLLSYNNGTGTSSGHRSPVTCVITDVVMCFPIDVAEELGIPVFSFSILSACFLFLVYCIPKLLEDGQLPYSDGNANQKLHGIPGAEGLIRCKDLPGLFTVENMEKNDGMNFVNHVTASSRTFGLIMNTFDELEAPFLRSLSKIYDKIYTIGPIHSLLKNSPCGLWKEDRSCLAWLDLQSPRSVVFVSFGSLVKITSSLLRELWNGLINSGKPFLLVLRSDIVKNNDEKQVVMKEIMETKLEGRCLVVSWAPQEEVLAHEAIGGFLTQAGWNSILEGIAAGVPMICCPQIVDQFSSSTWVKNVWKIGFEMEDPFDRSMIETMVRSMMEQKDETMSTRNVELAERVKNDVVTKDGTSNRNLKTLVEDITKQIKLN